MRFFGLFICSLCLTGIFASAADARPPFFIRYADVRKTAEAETVVVVDIVNPRNATVMLKAYMRPAGFADAGMAEDAAYSLIDAQSLMMAPASRRKLEFSAEAFQQGEYELVIEQQPAYFAGRDLLETPEIITLTSYSMDVEVKGHQGSPVITLGDIRKDVRQHQMD